MISRICVRRRRRRRGGAGIDGSIRAHSSSVSSGRYRLVSPAIFAS
jgi:hypothetical protein